MMCIDPLQTQCHAALRIVILIPSPAAMDIILLGMPLPGLTRSVHAAPKPASCVLTGSLAIPSVRTQTQPSNTVSNTHQRRQRSSRESSAEARAEDPVVVDVVVDVVVVAVSSLVCLRVGWPSSRRSRFVICNAESCQRSRWARLRFLPSPLRLFPERNNVTASLLSLKSEYVKGSLVVNPTTFRSCISCRTMP